MPFSTVLSTSNAESDSASPAAPNTTPVSLSNPSLSVIQPTLVQMNTLTVDSNRLGSLSSMLGVSGQGCTTALDQLGDVPTVTSLPRIIYRFGRGAARSGLIDALPLEDSVSSEVSDGNRMNFANGNFLCSPSSTAILDTKFGALKIAPGSLVLAMATEDGLAVFNLDDRCKNAVTIEHGLHKLSVSPGHHLFITDKGNVDFGDINVSEHILYSGLQESKLSSGEHVFNAQFYIPSAIESVKPLLQLVTSKDPIAKAKTNRLMKTVAILMQMGGGASSYQQHVRRSVTAWK
jgi:hypothetical protein